MTNFILGLIIGAVVGYLIGKQSGKGSVNDTAEGDAGGDRTRNLDENLSKLEKHITGMEGEIRNDDVEKLLGVSDATAERYLQEMENRGLLTQIGKEGRFVYYKKT